MVAQAHRTKTLVTLMMNSLPSTPTMPLQARLYSARPHAFIRKPANIHVNSMLWNAPPQRRGPLALDRFRWNFRMANTDTITISRIT